MLSKYYWLRWLVISGFVLAIDLYTKHLVINAFAYGEHLPVTSFFDLVRYHNEGAAFSFLAGAGGWQRIFFSAIALMAATVILYLLNRYPQRKLYCFALALILGGALGNLYDRLTLGYVVDFLFFYVHTYYWPAFNVADSAITCGVALLVWDSFSSSEKRA